MADTGPIVISERSGAVALLSRGEPDGRWQRREIAASGRWPAINPKRDLVALSRLEPEGSEIRSSIELVDFTGHEVRTLHTNPHGLPPVIAPRVPHYALWSPGGEVLSYVAQSSFGLALFLSEAGGAFVSDPIINGAPIFHSWCPDNNFVGVHSGTELAVVEVDGSRSTAEVARQAAGFRTPAFSDDAEIMAYAIPAEPGVAIMRALFQGTQGREVCRFAGGVALSFRPGTQELWVAVTREPETGTFGELWSIDLALEGEPRRAARGPFVAFTWAPTGDRLAMVVPTQSGDARYVVRCLGPDGAPLGATEGVVPSADYRIWLSFFDQYAYSHPLWSPDGSTFLVAGRLVDDGVSAAFGDPEGDWLFAWGPGKALERIAPADFGSFRPAPTLVR